jgi:uncharacterized protein (DUF58 family)
MSRFLDAEAAARLASMEVRARLIVEGFITGLHRSPYHGFSAEFSSHRAYNRGDELRRLDWKVLARTDKPFVKQYEDETNLRHHVVLDTSASMRYAGSAAVTKLEYGCYLAAALHGLMLRQRDATGLIAFDAGLHTVVRSSARPGHLQTLLVQLERLADGPPPASPTRTAAAAAIDAVAERIGRRALVTIVSDLYESASEPGELLRALKRLRSQGHEVIVFHLLDTQTERLLDLGDGPVRFEDLETGETLTLNPAHIRQSYADQARAFADDFRRGCREQRVDFVDVDIAAPFAPALAAYLVKRRSMRG